MAQLGQQSSVVVHDGLFEPHQIVRLQTFAPPKSGIVFHEAVGIHHQLDILSHRLSDPAHARFIFCGIFFTMLGAGSGDIHLAVDVEPAYLDLEPVMPLGHPVFSRLRQFFFGISSESISDVRRNRLLRAAEKAPDRSVIKFPLEIP